MDNLELRDKLYDSQFLFCFLPFELLKYYQVVLRVMINTVNYLLPFGIHKICKFEPLLRILAFCHELTFDCFLSVNAINVQLLSFVALMTK